MPSVLSVPVLSVVAHVKATTELTSMEPSEIKAEIKAETKAKSGHFVNFYNDAHSTGGDAMRDWTIGRDHGLIGSNKSMTLKKEHTWVLLKHKDRYSLGYTGTPLEARNSSQVWAEAGGHAWRNIFSTTHHIFLGDLDAFCTLHGLDRSIFTKSTQFGHPRAEYLPALDRAVAFALATSPV